jgi:hypothetical protein
VIRIQTPNGIKRITVPASATLKDVYEIAYTALSLVDYGFSLFKDRSCNDELRSSRSLTLKGSKLNHGDMIFYKQMAGSSVTIVNVVLFYNKSIITSLCRLNLNQAVVHPVILKRRYQQSVQLHLSVMILLILNSSKSKVVLNAKEMKNCAIIIATVAACIVQHSSLMTKVI